MSGFLLCFSFGNGNNNGNNEMSGFWLTVILVFLAGFFFNALAMSICKMARED